MGTTLLTLKKQKGIGLVEVIVALGIAVVVITSLVSLAVFTVRTSTQSSLQLEGTNYANKEVELLRAYRDSLVWETFKGAVRGCTQCSIQSGGGLLSISTTPAVENAGSPSQLTHSFSATVDDDSDVVHISVVASWNVGDQVKTTSVYTSLTDWQDK